ncbi:TPA: hypothetical protein DEB00_00295 [Candidatus Uhrbacteria bacterium]|nr:hypothetical protein [Candidatus Uhrbacteria bacterium]
MKIFTWHHRFLIASSTFLVVLVFGALGWWIGSAAGSVPAGVMIAVLFSYPVSLWLVARTVRHSFAKTILKEELEENPSTDQQKQ